MIVENDVHLIPEMPETSNTCPIRNEIPENTITANPGDQIEEELRRRLAFHFMDPVDKFIARRQVPWKLLLQFLKGVLIILFSTNY